MPLATPEQIQGRLLGIVLRYVGLAVAAATIALSGIVFYTVRWLLAGTVPAIVVLLLVCIVPVVILAIARRKKAASAVGLICGLFVAFGIGGGLLGMAIGPEPRWWAIEAWEAVVGPPVFLVERAAARWEDLPMRRNVLFELEYANWPPEAEVRIARAMIRDQYPLEDERERDVVERALGVLSIHSSQAGAAVPELTALVPDEKVGSQVIDVLSSIGPPAKPAAEAILKVAREQRDRRAADAVLKIDPAGHGRAAADQLAQDLLDKERQVDSWILLTKQPRQPAIRDAVTKVAAELPRLAAEAGEREELQTSLFVHHVLWLQGGQNELEIERAIDANRASPQGSRYVDSVRTSLGGRSAPPTGN